MKILLIAGHGQGDPGAMGNGYKEADLTREVVKLLKPQLDKYADVTIADPSKNWLNNKMDFSPFYYVLEIHFNAGVNDKKGNNGTTGTEIYITTSEKSHGVETEIVKGISSIGFKNRGVKRKNWAVINRAKSQGVSSALLEVCFIDDADDMWLFQKRKAEVIKAIANGIIKGFGLEEETTDDVAIIKNKIGLADETIEYLKAYKFGDELIRKIANAVK
jgi:N-acetylmuramoyl-L-alanine amidase